MEVVGQTVSTQQSSQGLKSANQGCVWWDFVDGAELWMLALLAGGLWEKEGMPVHGSRISDGQCYVS